MSRKTSNRRASRPCWTSAIATFETDADVPDGREVSAAVRGRPDFYLFIYFEIKRLYSPRIRVKILIPHIAYL